ncbi:MAG: carboxypeptidase-like regulatory domain-containing protein, partial [Methanoregulaceae archaeon]
SKGNRVSETRNFTVNAGGPPPPPLITLYGRVTDMFEKPIPNATVTVVSVYGSISRTDSTQTSENGSYRLEYVLAYQQNISVEKEGYPRKSWEKNFDSRMTEFNMHLDIDRSASPGTAAGTLSPDETNASRMQTRPAPIPLAASLVAIGIVFAAVGILRKK